MHSFLFIEQDLFERPSLKEREWYESSAPNAHGALFAHACPPTPPSPPQHTHTHTHTHTLIPVACVVAEDELSHVAEVLYIPVYDAAPHPGPAAAVAVLEAFISARSPKVCPTHQVTHLHQLLWHAAGRALPPHAHLPARCAQCAWCVPVHCAWHAACWACMRATVHKGGDQL